MAAIVGVLIRNCTPPQLRKYGSSSASSASEYTSEKLNELNDAARSIYEEIKAKAEAKDGKYKVSEAG